MAGTELTFPLKPRRRLIGLAFGAMASSRRGMGSDVAGSRPYRPGDDVRSIDWNASARLSSARGTDEFVVRERFADEAPRVVIVADRRPSMSLYPPPLPWLNKPDAARAAAVFIADSAVAARGLSGYLDFGEGDAYWRPPRSQHEDWRLERRRPFAAPEDNLSRSLLHLMQLRPPLAAGSFVFVISDFIVTPPEELWLRAIDRRWDLVPVVLQDPVWERSFPDISGTTVPFADPATGWISRVRMRPTEVEERRTAHEERWQRLLQSFRNVDVEPVVVTSSSPPEILAAFVAWSEQRTYSRDRAAL